MLRCKRQYRFSSLRCFGNQITSLDLDTNLQLENLYANNNVFIEIDVSLNSNFKIIEVAYNDLTELYVANGNNENVTSFTALDCPNLTCIEVDDVTYSEANWTKVDDPSFLPKIVMN